MKVQAISLILALVLGLLPTNESPRDSFVEMYASACLELWEKDSGLNHDAEILAFDFTECNTLDQAQREALMKRVGETLELEVREGTFEQLAEEGLIVFPDPEERPQWCEFPTGLLISLQDQRQEDGSVKFSLEKWRTPLGAYWLHDCTAISDDGVPEAWSYTVGAELIS